jgi:hypothetical protein
MQWAAVRLGGKIPNRPQARTVLLHLFSDYRLLTDLGAREPSELIQICGVTPAREKPGRPLMLLQEQQR